MTSTIHTIHTAHTGDQAPGHAADGEPATGHHHERCCGGRRHAASESQTEGCRHRQDHPHRTSHGGHDDGGCCGGHGGHDR
jgi:hypothetical protein